MQGMNHGRCRLEKYTEVINMKSDNVVHPFSVFKMNHIAMLLLRQMMKA